MADLDRDRAVTLIDLGRFDDAARLIGEGIAREPDNWRLRCDLCRCLLPVDRLDDALDAAGAALAIAPDREWPWRLRALTLSRLGRHPEAVVAARRSVELAPELADAHIMLSQTLRNDDRTRDALDAAFVAVRLAPENAHSHDAVGRCRLSVDDPVGAEQAFRQALTIAPTSAEHCNNLGLALQLQGRETEAVEMFARAASLDPTDPLYRRNVGISAHRLTKVSFPVGGAAVAAFLVGGLPVLVLVLAVCALYLGWRRHRETRRLRGSDGQPLAPGVAAAMHEYRREQRGRLPWPSVTVSVAGLAIVLVAASMDSPENGATSGADQLLLFGCAVTAVGVIWWLRTTRRARRS